MNHFELFPFPGEIPLAEAAAKRWVEAVMAAAAQHSKPCCVALAGGRVARPFFSSVVQECKQRRAPLHRVHFFWSDERCVPPEDSNSNFAVAQEHLFVPLNIAARQIHRIRGEIEPQAAVAEAEAEVAQTCPLNEQGLPVFDLILLGMGEDGHVASLFPHEPQEVLTSRSVYRHVRASKPPPNRITLSYQTIAAARQVWILASGSGKEWALKESLALNGTTPLAEVLKMRNRTFIFTDIKTTSA